MLPQMAFFIPVSWLSDIPLCVYIYIYMHRICFAHSSASGHLGGLLVSGTVNSVAVNLAVPVGFGIGVLSEGTSFLL